MTRRITVDIDRIVVHGDASPAELRREIHAALRQHLLTPSVVSALAPAHRAMSRPRPSQPSQPLGARIAEAAIGAVTP